MQKTETSLTSGSELQRRLREHVEAVYTDVDFDNLVESLIETMGLAVDAEGVPPHRNLWDEGDAYLITYGNSVVADDEKPLATLRRA